MCCFYVHCLTQLEDAILYVYMYVVRVHDCSYSQTKLSVAKLL